MGFLFQSLSVISDYKNMEISLNIVVTKLIFHMHVMILYVQLIHLMIYIRKVIVDILIPRNIIRSIQKWKFHPQNLKS